MSAARRLWRRAPAWRLLLFVAVAATALTAMFPPRLPAWLARQESGPAGPRYRPRAEAPPAPVTRITLPPLGEPRQTMIPFAGRQLPLPQGKWTEVALLSAAGTFPQQGLVLARLVSGRMTGLIIVRGTPPTGRDDQVEPGACVDATGRPMHVLAPPKADGQAAMECWFTRSIAASKLMDPANPLESHVLTRLGGLDIAVPAHLLVSLYYRHVDGATFSVATMLPDPSESAALMRQVETWMRRWVPLLHRGFDAALEPSDIKPKLAHDPEEQLP